MNFRVGSHGRQEGKIGYGKEGAFFMEGAFLTFHNCLSYAEITFIL
jgi:hypothetical protein